MGLFERFHLSQEEAESRLKRALTGDPTRGEIALLAALGANKLDDVQSCLARDATLGADLRELVAEHLQKARALGDSQGMVRHAATSDLGRVRPRIADHGPLGHGMPRVGDQTGLRAEEGNAGATGDP